MVSRVEFLQQLKKAPADSIRPQLRAEFTRAALDAKAVSGIPEWDVFCTYVQGWVDQLGKRIDATRRTLESEGTVDPVEIARLRQSIMADNIRVDTFRKVISFPRDIIAREQQMEKFDG